MPGLLVLREQIARFVARTYLRSVCPLDEVTITSGATEALFVAIQALVHPGDEVIVFDPAYESYQPAVELAGGETVHFALDAPLYQIDWLQVEALVTSKTRLIIVNSPHNPTGQVFTATDWLALEQIVHKYGLYCISDEVYEHIVFDGVTKLSANSYPALAERTVIVSSFGKTFHITGWKLGYATAPKALTAELRKIHQYVTFSSFTPAQHAVAEMMQKKPEQMSVLGEFFQKKRDLFRQGLSLSRFKVLPCQGTYFQLVDYSSLSELDDIRFCEYLTRVHKVAAIPLSVFYHQAPTQQVIRFCFAKQESTLSQASELLCRVSK